MPGGRVVITGMGLVTPLGHEIESAWSSLLAGENGIRPVEGFEAGTFPTNFAGEVKGYDPADFVDMTHHGDADQQQPDQGEEVIDAEAISDR